MALLERHTPLLSAADGCSNAHKECACPASVATKFAPTPTHDWCIIVTLADYMISTITFIWQVFEYFCCDSIYSASNWFKSSKPIKCFSGTDLQTNQHLVFLCYNDLESHHFYTEPFFPHTLFLNRTLWLWNVCGLWHCTFCLRSVYYAVMNPRY